MKKGDSTIELAAKLISQGKVLIFPTDTVYGLICDVTNKKAIKRLFEIKKRTFQKPIPVFVENVKMAKKLAKINKKQEMFLKQVWPGKVTVVLEAKKELHQGVLSQDGKVGLRIPDYELLNALLQKVKLPLSATSANISGEPASGKIEEVIKQFKRRKLKPDFVIDSKNLKLSKPSTVVDLTKDKLKVLRRGAIKKEKLIKYFK